MSSADLLLTAERLAQFEAALGAGGLDKLISEAETYVGTRTAGFEVEQEVLDGFVRTIVLRKAHIVAEGSAPEDLKADYDQVLSDLAKITSGEWSLSRSDEGEVSADGGAWGSQTRLAMRGDPT